jgi:hypothetical protein
MSSTPPSRWIKFLRNYGPIPTNDNMYDETIQRALGRLKIEPLVLPAQFLDQVLTNPFSSQPSKVLRTCLPCPEVLIVVPGPNAQVSINERTGHVGDFEGINQGHMNEMGS